MVLYAARENKTKSAGLKWGKAKSPAGYTPGVGRALLACYEPELQTKAESSASLRGSWKRPGLLLPPSAEEQSELQEGNLLNCPAPPARRQNLRSLHP